MGMCAKFLGLIHNWDKCNVVYNFIPTYSNLCGGMESECGWTHVMYKPYDIRGAKEAFPALFTPLEQVRKIKTYHVESSSHASWKQDLWPNLSMANKMSCPC